MFNNYPIFWNLIGQSNAQGADDPSNCPSKYSDINKNSFIYNTQNRAIECCILGVNNTNTPIELFNSAQLIPRNGYKMGIEIALNKLLTDHYRCNTYLFKYGWGGSGLISAGSYGGWWAPTTNNCYTYNLNYLLEGVKKINVKRKKLHFAVWIQGEQDIANTSVYAINLRSFILEYRKSIGYNIPFVVVSLSNQQTGVTTFANLNAFKVEQQKVASIVYNSALGLISTQSGGITMDGVIFIDQNEACLGDNIHYAAQSYCNIAEYIYACRGYLGIR